jgi:MFS transporter, FHS family, glucose/mannose:H+ symporter
MRVFRVAIAIAFASALLLELAPSVAARNVAMFLLGAALAPTYPLVLAGFFARARHTADSRWILFTAGFGGSVLPWIAGIASTHTGSLRAGMFTVPVALVIMGFILPALREPQSATKNR